MKNYPRYRNLFLVLFFGLQIMGIIIGKFSNTRYFCWAPYDEISLYEIQATIDGEKLEADEIQNRYRIEPKGRENRSIQNVISIIKQYETTYGVDEHTEIEVYYVVNGHRKGTWIWPENEFLSKE